MVGNGLVWLITKLQIYSE